MQSVPTVRDGLHALLGAELNFVRKVRHTELGMLSCESTLQHPYPSRWKSYGRL